MVELIRSSDLENFQVTVFTVTPFYPRDISKYQVELFRVLSKVGQDFSIKWTDLYSSIVIKSKESVSKNKQVNFFDIEGFRFYQNSPEFVSEGDKVIKCMHFPYFLGEFREDILFKDPLLFI